MMDWKSGLETFFLLRIGEDFSSEDETSSPLDFRLTSDIYCISSHCLVKL